MRNDLEYNKFVDVLGETCVKISFVRGNDPVSLSLNDLEHQKFLEDGTIRVVSV